MNKDEKNVSLVLPRACMPKGLAGGTGKLSVNY